MRDGGQQQERIMDARTSSSGTAAAAAVPTTSSTRRRIDLEEAAVRLNQTEYELLTSRTETISRSASSAGTSSTTTTTTTTGASSWLRSREDAARQLQELEDTLLAGGLDFPQEHAGPKQRPCFSKDDSGKEKRLEHELENRTETTSRSKRTGTTRTSTTTTYSRLSNREEAARRLREAEDSLVAQKGATLKSGGVKFQQEHAGPKQRPCSSKDDSEKEKRLEESRLKLQKAREALREAEAVLTLKKTARVSVHRNFRQSEEQVREAEEDFFLKKAQEESFRRTLQ
jgi:hypothetical protein